MKLLSPDIFTMARVDIDGKFVFRKFIVISLLATFTILLGVFFFSVLWSSGEYEDLTDEKLRESIEELFPILQQDEAKALESMLVAIIRIEDLKLNFRPRTVLGF